MSKTQKKAGIAEYKPSKYQEAIFDFIQNKEGNLLIEATAGSGKTWTLVKSIELIPEDKSILFAAFNKDICNDLEKKTQNFSNVRVSTIHSFGYYLLRKAFPGQFRKEEAMNSFKYRNYAKLITKDKTRRMNSKTFLKYIDNIESYVNFGRNYLCSDANDFKFIQERYGIEDVDNEIEVAIQCLAWGMNHLGEIDYGDMIWLPNVLDIDIKDRFDYILLDECQDVNKAQRYLILKCMDDKTRLICVGDSNQAIYSFAGSDPESFNELRKLPNMTCMPLSISYRCAKNIVTFANNIVPTMEPNNDGREGEVKYDMRLEDVQNGDMMICRNNAPLMQIYLKLLKMGKNAFIRGKDDGKQLIKAVKRTGQTMLNRNCMHDGVFARLYDEVFRDRNSIMEQNEISEIEALNTSEIMAKLDVIRTLEYLSEDVLTAEELIHKLEKIFKKTTNEEDNANMEYGIALSTIHKAKGLEADRVFIIANSLMPSKSAKKDWEVRQEMNLMYVAHTRAKNHLFFLDEGETDDCDATSDYNMTILKMKERNVNMALRSMTSKVLSIEDAARMLKQAKPIIKTSTSSNTVNITGTSAHTSFGDVWKKQKRKPNARKKIKT